MPEIQNNFSQGKMNQDLDERLVPKGQYRNALNIQVSTSEGSDVGTVQNILGNARIESVIGGNWICVGAISDEKNDRFIWFVKNPNRNAIFEYNASTSTTTPVIIDTNMNVLNFDGSVITGINIIDDVLLWTDNINEPRKINIERCKLGANATSPNSTHTKLVVNGVVTNDDLEEKHITTIKQRPNIAPEVHIQKEINTIPVAVLASLSQGNLGQDLSVKGDTVEIYIPYVQISNIGFGWWNPGIAQLGTPPGIGDILLLSQSNLPGALPSNAELKGEIVNIAEAGNPSAINDTVITLEILSIDPNLPITITTFDSNGQAEAGLEMNTIKQEDISQTLFTEKFIRFATRWKYEDGEYSAFSPFTQTAFNPTSFSFHPVKDTYNLGMQNNFKAATLTKIIPPNTPKDVVQIDILFKLENSTTIYSIDSIKKDDPPAPGNSVNIFNAVEESVAILEPNNTLNASFDISGGYSGVYTINSENIYAALPSNQLLRPWDNVPKKALAQEITGNRVVYGNYVQGYSMVDSNNIDVKPFISVDYRQRSYDDDDVIDFREGKKSLKTFKNYQVGVVYGDEYGRETPVFTSQNASFKIPWDSDETSGFLGNASRSIQLTARLTGDQPSFASYYKFFVKETSGEYYNLTMDRIYRSEDSENLWISFPSSDINKIQKEEYIILKKQVDTNEQIPQENKYKVIDIKNEAPDYIKFDKENLGSVGGVLSKVQSLYIGYSTGLNIPEVGQNQIEILKSTWISEGGADLSSFEEKMDLIFTKMVGASPLHSQTYDIVSVSETNNNLNYKITLSKSISEADNWVLSSQADVTIEPTLSLLINRKIPKEGGEFQGRFFVKIIIDLLAKQYLESLIVQEVTYRHSLSIDSYYLADEQVPTGGDAANGVVNTNVDRYSAGATADPESLTTEPKSNTKTAWEKLYEFGNATTTPSFFLDQAYFASVQPIDSSDPSGQTGSLKCSKGGRFVRGSGGSNGQFFVDSIEGIVDASQGSYSVIPDPPVVTSDFGWGARHWTTRSLGMNNNVSFASGNEIDPIYAPDPEGQDWSGSCYMHLSFGPVGDPLYGSGPQDAVSSVDYPLSSTKNFPNTVKTFWNHIDPGDITSTYPADTSTSSIQPAINLAHPGGPVLPVNNAGLMNTPFNAWKYYNQDPTNLPYLEQWKIKNPAQADLASRIVTGAQFRIEGSLEVFTIGRVRVKRLYNHTPFMKTQFAWDGTANVDRVPVSVEQRYAEWASFVSNSSTSNTADYFKAGYDPTIQALHDTLKDFGDPSNRRLLYIIELDKNPNNFLTDADFTFDVDTLQKIRFVEPIVRTGDTSPTISPAIWETQIKEETDLNIYYEASDAIPIELNKSKSNSEVYAPIGSRVWCSKNNSIPQYTNTSIEHPLRITNWESHTNGDYTIVEIASPGLNVIGADTTLSGQTTEYYNRTLRFFKSDDSYVSARIVEAAEISTNNLYVTKFRLRTNNFGKFNGLSYYDCFSFGNGVESNRVRDDFNAMVISNGAKASATLEEQYKEEHRKNGLIYSGIYNSTSGVNNLNQFIQAEKITKDLNPTFGSIQKLFQRRIDLVTFCEDKVVKILSNKDALYNADGNAQLISTNRVLGDANPFVGDYGISKDPASFAKESYRAYFTDKQRGAVLRLSMDGLTPISDAGMHDYFRDNLSISDGILGSYDAYKGNYNLTLKGDNRDDVTISYDEKSKGWSSFKSFIPDFGLSCANNYYTFNEGQAYKHHVLEDLDGDPVTRNFFYGNQFNSTIDIVINDQPELIKSFNTINYEGSEGWGNVTINTDQQSGTVADFIEKEGKWFNYIRGTNEVDLQAFNFQGIGQTTGIEYNI